MMLTYVTGVVILNFIKLVNAKTCLRSDNIYETFTCGVYEYCCGTRCCRAPIITFYQMWYFWLMVFLTILFCSGGGWWYRIRNQDAYFTPSMARMTHVRPVIHPARGPTIFAATVTMPHMPTAPHATHVPPPPYYGPPPSYETVVLNQHQYPMQNPNQSQVPLQNQNLSQVPQQPQNTQNQNPVPRQN